MLGSVLIPLLAGVAVGGEPVAAVRSDWPQVLTLDDIGSALRGDLRFMGGKRLRIVLQDTLADWLVEDLTGMDPDAFERHWMARTFQGLGSPPERLPEPQIRTAVAALPAGTVVLVDEELAPTLRVAVRLPEAGHTAPPPVVAGLLGRIVDHDRARAGQMPLTLAVVAPDGRLGHVCATELTDALSGDPRWSILVHRPESDLAGVDVAWLCPGLRPALPSLAADAQTYQVLMITSSPEAVPFAAVGVMLRGGNPTIVVNLETARATGTDFDAGLLRIAEVR